VGRADGLRQHEALMLHGQRVCHYRDPACVRVRRARPLSDGAGTDESRRRRTHGTVVAPRVSLAAGRVAAPSRRPGDPVIGRDAPNAALTSRRKETRLPHNFEGADGTRLAAARAGEPPERRRERSGALAHERRRARAHGTHGKGGSEELLDDRRRPTPGDDAQLRRSAAAATRPVAREVPRQRAGPHGRLRAGGASRSAGSSVDRRPPDRTRRRPPPRLIACT
jgi:hypothetical protein